MPTKQKKKNILLGVVFGVVLFGLSVNVSFASLTYNPLGWPTYSDNGQGNMYVQDSTVYRYYGGQVFTVPNGKDWSATALSVWACYNSTTTPKSTENGNITYEIGDITTTNWETNGYFQRADADSIVETTLDLPECTNNGGVAEIDLSALLPSHFIQGHTYAIWIADASYGQGNIDFDDIEVERTSPSSNAISVCSPNQTLICGDNMLINSSGVYGLFMVFGGTDAWGGDCIIGSAPYFQPVECLQTVMTWAFVPSDQTLNEWKSLSLASTSPVGYIYDIKSQISSLASTTGTSTLLAIDLGDFVSGLTIASTTDISVMDASKVSSNLGSLWSTVQTILTYMLWLGFMFYIYKKVLTFI